MLNNLNPKWSINLKPYASEGYQIKYVDVDYEFENYNLKKDDILVSIYLKFCTIPCAELSQKGVVAKDDNGLIPLEFGYGDGHYGHKQQWKLGRDTVGKIYISYRFYPRVVYDDYKYMPYYDFRNEQYGANGTGISFLIQPKEQIYDISFKWDLSEMPEETTGICTLGDGDFNYQSIPLNFCVLAFFQVGKTKIVKYEEYEGIEFCYLSDPKFDVKYISQNVVKTYYVLAKFFKDEDIKYKILIRKDPFKLSNGATAYMGGFVYGYSDYKPLVLEKALDTFAHEVVHNYPFIEDIQGEAGWFNEGVAEYYSIVIPYRAGITNIDYVLEQINWRSLKYYTNEYINWSDLEAYKKYWVDRHAQWLPYGKGVFYMIDTDMKIREKSNGKRSLDDLVLKILEIRNKEGVVKVDRWLELIEKELGKDAVDDLNKIREGKTIEPNENWFNGVFEYSMGYVYDEMREYGAETYKWKLKKGIDEKNIIL